MGKKILGVIQFIIGLILSMFFIGSFLVGFDHNAYKGSTIPIMIVSFILAILSLNLVGKGVKNFRLREVTLQNQYTSLLIDQHITSINELATKLNKDGETVKTEIQELIDKGLLEGAYIDHQYSIVNFKTKKSESKAPVTEEVQNKAAGPKTISCKSCGANNVVVPGQTKVCEYCGSALV